MRRGGLLALVVGLVAAVTGAVALGPWVLAALLPLGGLGLVLLVRGSAPAAAPSLALPGPEAVAGLAAPARTRARAGLREAAGVLAALDGLSFEPPGVRDQVAALAQEIVAAAGRADRCDRYLGSVDRHALSRRLDESGGTAPALAEQLRALDALARRRAELDAELREVEAALGAMRARALEAGAAAGGAPSLGTDVRALRDDVRAVADALGEVYGSLPGPR